MQQADSRPEGRHTEWPNLESTIHALNAATAPGAILGLSPWQAARSDPKSPPAHGSEARAGSAVRTGSLPSPARAPEGLSSLLHDTRNMISSIDLYCDLLEEPGVLTPGFGHYARDLRLIAGASRRLLHSLAGIECRTSIGTNLDPNAPPHGSLASESSGRALDPNQAAPMPVPTAPGVISTHLTDRIPNPGQPFAAGSNAGSNAEPNAGSDASWKLQPASAKRPPEGSFDESRSSGAVWSEWDATPDGRADDDRQQSMPAGQPIDSLAVELSASLNLLSAVAGPAITVESSISGADRPIALTSDDLIRILINLASNSAQAMPQGGHIQVDLREDSGSMRLTFSDTGKGIPAPALEAVFLPGYTTHVSLPSKSGSEPLSWPARHRGLGLSIVRSLMSSAGGSVWAALRPAGRNLNSEDGAVLNDVPGGTDIVLEFPIREGRETRFET